MIDRLRLSASAKNQLVTLKRRTGIEHYNVICRHALCLSLANPSVPPDETYGTVSGVEIDWRTFTGGQEILYLNLLAARLASENTPVTAESLRLAALRHVHRGLAYLAGRRDEDLLTDLARAIAST